MSESLNITPSEIDRKITFSEGFVPVSPVSLNLLSRKENLNIINKINYFDNGKKIIFVSLFAGYYSSFTKNEILNSKFYNKDESIFEKFSAYNENSSYKGKEIKVGMNPVPYVKTLGMNNPDPIFDDYIPFEDLDRLEDVNEYFKLPKDKKYPFYYGYYSVSKLNSNISVFGTLESINGNLTTEVPLQGMNVEIIKNGRDARNREIFISNKISIRELEKSNKKIESFSDSIIEDLPTNDVVSFNRKYAYQRTIFNGRNVVNSVSGENVNEHSYRLTNIAYYYNDDQLDIVPFDDSRQTNTINLDHDDEAVYSSAGNDSNKINGGLPLSIAYLGELI
jgi:hypothetical protein